MFEYEPEPPDDWFKNDEEEKHMIIIKYTVEMEVPDSIVAALKANPAGVTIDDVVQTRIENALLPIFKGGSIKVYGSEGKKAIDIYKDCPECGHPWAKHFEQTKKVEVSMSDGTPGTREVLSDPVPTYCSECAEMLPKGNFSCREALKYGCPK